MDKWMRLIGAIALLGAGAKAHLVAGSLSVKAGDKVTAGSVVNVKWTIDIAHPQYDFDIKLSTNGGTSFQTVETKKFPSSTGEVTYPWTVPNTPSKIAQIEICQHEGTSSCEYSLNSGNFTIEASSGILNGKTAIQHPGIVFDPDTKHFDISLRLSKEEIVKIQVLDMQGREIISLADERYPAGLHRKSFFSHAFDVSRPLVFQVRIGNEVHSMRWSSLR